MNVFIDLCFEDLIERMMGEEILSIYALNISLCIVEFKSLEIHEGSFRTFLRFDKHLIQQLCVGIFYNMTSLILSFISFFVVMSIMLSLDR